MERCWQLSVSGGLNAYQGQPTSSGYLEGYFCPLDVLNNPNFHDMTIDILPLQSETLGVASTLGTSISVQNAGIYHTSA